MDDDEIKSLSFYQGNGYLKINKFFRDFQDLDKIIKHTKRIDNVLTTKHVGKTVYRGISNLSALLDITSEAGFDHTFIDHGYSSTSTDFCKAVRFTENSCCVLSFSIPEGIKGFHFSEDENNDFMKMKEDEILLERNLQYFLSEPVLINGIKVYPCIVKKYIPNVSDKDMENALLVKKQLVKISQDIPKQTEKDILDQILTEIGVKDKSQWQFDNAYRSLCLLDKSKKDKVYQLFRDFIQK